MKHGVTRSVLFSQLVVLVLGLVPSARALDGHGITFTDARWDIPCSTGQGKVSYTLTVSIPAGYTVIHRWESGDDPIWGADSGVFEFAEPNGWYLQRSFYWLIGTPGWQKEVWEVYAPTGVLVSTAYFYASCATGEIILREANIYGIQQPGAAARVQTQVLYDTPVYSLPDPATALADTLLAGQAWFVVDQTTGTDGRLWYEVFVGGWHNAFVPADALYLPGPLP